MRQKDQRWRGRRLPSVLWFNPRELVHVVAFTGGDDERNAGFFLDGYSWLREIRHLLRELAPRVSYVKVQDRDGAAWEWRRPRGAFVPLSPWDAAGIIPP